MFESAALPRRPAVGSAVMSVQWVCHPSSKHLATRSRRSRRARPASLIDYGAWSAARAQNLCGGHVGEDGFGGYLRMHTLGASMA